MSNSFNTRDTLSVEGQPYHYHRLTALDGHARLPCAIKILLENLLRHEDGHSVTAEDIRAVLAWDSQAEPTREIAFRPARVLLQDFTGVPAVVDLAAMRDAMARLGGDPARINPLQPVELVIDHSVQVDHYGSKAAFQKNADLEYERNGERYRFLKWGQQAFDDFKVVPPDTGIVHQINLEYLARVTFTQDDGAGQPLAYPDTLVGTDSHTTMINGLGILGWGVGGIEAEAAMLGQPISMLVPQVVGVRLRGQLPPGATATDLVLTLTQRLRQHGVVGKFVEFFGDGLARLPVADRATLANMAPEYGATCGLFPIDAETLQYLRLTGRSEQHIALVETYAKGAGLWRDSATPEAEYSSVIDLDLSNVVPALAGPRRPQDLIPLSAARAAVETSLDELLGSAGKTAVRDSAAARFEDEGGHTAVGVEQQRTHRGQVPVRLDDQEFFLDDGMCVLAAITSCTNTSNPSVMLAAGLLAQKARAHGLHVKPWVKTSLAPGSRTVETYLAQAGLLNDLMELGFHIVGYGCTTCIGNSGPLHTSIVDAIHQDELVVCSVLSGNRNFEGRIHSEVHLNYLASPPLVVAYALAGRMDIDLEHEPLAVADNGQRIYLKDLWPAPEEVQTALVHSVDTASFRQAYGNIYSGDQHWQALAAPAGKRFAWDSDSTYIQNPPYFEGMSMQPATITDIQGARCLALLGDTVTTDHISPAGAIQPDSPAGRYLQERGVAPADFNSYGARRGNHEVMMRGTFANPRLRNHLAVGTQGGVTLHLPSHEPMSIYDAAMRYHSEGVELIVIAGKEYGTGSSRDWAAKGSKLLGVRAVIAESFERIHRANLVGMGILPIQFQAGQNAGQLGLTGHETFALSAVDGGTATMVTITATPAQGAPIHFEGKVRLDTPQEIAYFQHGGIMPYVLRQLLT